MEQTQTSKHKELKIYQVANSSLFKVAFTDGGQLPEDLTGKWTNAKLAQDAIEIYLNEQADKFAAIAKKQLKN